jgi:hypothetical protein
LNRHVLHARSDWEASIDELQAVCPNLEHVSLIVAWFGDDLRAGDVPDPARVSFRHRAAARARHGVSPAWDEGMRGVHVDLPVRRQARLWRHAVGRQRDRRDRRT